ncbi:hypothetical protein PR202_gb11263 [Eleusine coracana subsp. coracana]|uniref:Uncharacterized protein n=1 Tax=Eleusine coracana subsp. coracana TaxID=191504 RepID=A0AAV5EM41_ELECO|nr:hypothetical protein PR202_gb11263 [Eleusine coracana subsp. coracana]
MRQRRANSGAGRDTQLPCRFASPRLACRLHSTPLHPPRATHTHTRPSPPLKGQSLGSRELSPQWRGVAFEDQS